MQQTINYDIEDNNQPVTVLGKTFSNDDERRKWFRNELRRKLPELKNMEGFPIGDDDDIIELSDPPYYTACPNPWLNDFIEEWEKEKKNNNKRHSDRFSVKSPYPDDVKSGKNHPIYNAHSYHTKVPHEITTKKILYYTQPGDIVLDSFAGTGMSGVGGSYSGSIIYDEKTYSKFKDEFKKLNKELHIGKRNVINIDLSSIASHISHIYNTNFDKELFISEYNKVIEKLESVAYLYETEENKISGTINYTVFAQVYTCNHCGHNFNYYEAVYITDSNMRKKPKCPKCGFEEKKNKLTPYFKTSIDVVTNEITNQIVYEPIRINYSINRQRFTKEPDLKDIRKFKETSLIVKQNIPTDNLIEGGETERNIKYGLGKVHHFYTNRTLTLISIYLEEIKKLKLKNHFIFLLTSILPKLTKMNRFMPQHGSRALVGPMANTMYIPPMYVENNFINQLGFQYRKIIKALDITSNQVVSQQSATNLVNIKDKSIDYIFVDPPFGANIMYSELNNLSESWLKILTNNTKEAIENTKQMKGKFEYEKLISTSFNELYRVLKPNSWMSVEFSNTSAAIWNIIQNSINRAGFIITKIDSLNKTRGGLHAMIGPVAVKQDLVISCYKPSSDFVSKFTRNSSNETAVWDFIERLLNRLPIQVVKENTTTSIVERSARILFDKLIVFYIMKDLPVPIDSNTFQKGLRERFVERDGMFFNSDQVEEYDRIKSETSEFIQLNIFVANEQDAIYWLRQKLEVPSTESDLHKDWMTEVAGNMRKGDTLPEMRTILEENFLRDEESKWYIPDMENEADLEKLRSKRLLKIFDGYKEAITKPRARLREVRVEALRTGFKQCYQDKDFETIIAVGDRIPNNLLMEDEVLLQYYDIASSRV